MTASHYQSGHRLLPDPDSSAPIAILSNHIVFDANMVIILAALLCALICALVLNSIVRCALHRARSNNETPEQTAARLTATGMKKSEVQQIPVVMYGAVEEGVCFVATECAICLGEFVDGEKVRVLSGCKHGFHVVCIDTWLVSHSSCPTCRQSLLEHEPTQDDSESGIRNRSVPNAQTDVSATVYEIV